MVFDTNENSKKEMIKYLNVKGIKKWKKLIHITLEANVWVTNIDEYFWMMYDTTDTEKLDSHIEDIISPTELNLKGIITVRVIKFSTYNLNIFWWTHIGIGKLKYYKVFKPLS